MAKKESAPVPRGPDTEILGFLTAVGDWEHGNGRAPTIDRLFMRLRIFWFFLMAIPILVGAGIVTLAATSFAAALLGPGETGRSVAGAVGLATFAVAAVLLVSLLARWFDRLTRGYRARLEARSAMQSAAAAARDRERAGAEVSLPLAELDARLAQTASSDPERG